MAGDLDNKVQFFWVGRGVFVVFDHSIDRVIPKMST